MTEPVSIWSVAPPPYEQYLYVMMNHSEARGAFVAVGLDSFSGFRSVVYPPGDTERAKAEARELTAIIACTRRLLGMTAHTELLTGGLVQ